MNRQTPKTDWYAEGLHFSCTQCGNCCGGAPGYVWVDLDEITEIARSLDMTPEDFAKKHVRRVGKRFSLLELRNGDCEFLERTGHDKTRCSIHSVRPLQCRTWPFWKSNLESERAWNATGRGCPGINQGTHHPLPVIQDALMRNDTAHLPL